MNTVPFTIRAKGIARFVSPGTARFLLIGAVIIATVGAAHQAHGVYYTAHIQPPLDPACEGVYVEACFFLADRTSPVESWEVWYALGIEGEACNRIETATVQDGGCSYPPPDPVVGSLNTKLPSKGRYPLVDGLSQADDMDADKHWLCIETPEGTINLIITKDKDPPLGRTTIPLIQYNGPLCPHIPTVSAWGLGIMGLLLATFGKLYFRRRSGLSTR